ncbi:MAG: hypothetical protein SFU21_02715 [Flavihumibacter sp.]|nr:hypothetical protein [Flavihumibacter sp.]
MPKKIVIDDVVVLNSKQEFQMAPVAFSLNEDSKVSGYGNFVRTDAAEKMINDYVYTNEMIYAAIEEALSILNQLPVGQSRISNCITLLTAAKNVMAPTNDVVSGVYGKELLQTLLSRDGCEGLRYTCCRYKGKSSIVFTPVDKDGENKKDKDYYDNKISIEDTDPKGEIKMLEITRGELVESLKNNTPTSEVTEFLPSVKVPNWGKELLQRAAK